MNVLKQRSFALTRVVLVMMLVALSLASLPAGANPPPWWTGPGTTYQTWVWDDTAGEWGLAAWMSNPELPSQKPTVEKVDDAWRWRCPNFKHSVPKRIRIDLSDVNGLKWDSVKVWDIENNEEAQFLEQKDKWAEWQMRRCWPFYVKIASWTPPAGATMRIYTQCVPEPGTMLLSAIGFGVVGAALRRRRKV